MRAAGSPHDRFEFATAGRIMFGQGAAAHAPSTVCALGGRPLLVTGRDTARVQWVIDALERAGAPCEVISIDTEPDLESVRRGSALARQAGCDVVVGVGGGSAIDASKAIAAMATNAGDPLDYLEVVGRGQLLERAPLPVVAIPTTAGTGSEVTRNAVRAVREARVKASLRSPLMIPRVAIIDPDLTLDLPPGETANTGLDALTQLIEPFLSVRANAMTDALCREAIPKAARAIRRAYADGRNAAARGDMALAALFGGMALANAGLGAVHGFAAPIGGRFQAPHGAVCAALLAPVFAITVRALRERAPDGLAAARVDEVGRLLTGNAAAAAADAHRWLLDTTRALGIRGLSAYGIGAQDVDSLVDEAARASSMKGNPIALTADEMREAVAAAL